MSDYDAMHAWRNEYFEMKAMAQKLEAENKALRDEKEKAEYFLRDVGYRIMKYRGRLKPNETFDADLWIAKEAVDNYFAGKDKADGSV